MKPAPFDYVRAETLAEAHDVLAAEGGDDARMIAGGQTLVPMLSMRMARPTVVVDIMHVERARRNRGRGQRDPRRRGGAAGRICWHGRNWPKRQPLLAPPLPWVGHAQTRAAARSAARSRSPIRAPNCRWRCSRSAASVVLSSQGERRRRAAEEFLHRTDVDRAQRRRADRGGRRSLPGGRVRVSRSASSRAATAISPSWPARRSRAGTESGSRSAASRIGRSCATFRTSTATRSTTRSTTSPTSSTRATICTRPPTIAASWCAGSAVPRSRRRADAAPERRRAPPRPPRAQRPRGRGRGRAAHAADRLPAPRPRPDRHACRLRARRLRRLHDRRSTARRRAPASRSRCRPTAPASAPSRAWRPSPAGSRCCRRRSAAITRCNAASAPPAS